MTQTAEEICEAFEETAILSDLYRLCANTTAYGVRWALLSISGSTFAAQGQTVPKLLRHHHLHLVVELHGGHCVAVRFADHAVGPGLARWLNPLAPARLQAVQADPASLDFAVLQRWCAAHRAHALDWPPHQARIAAIWQALLSDREIRFMRDYGAASLAAWRLDFNARVDASGLGPIGWEDPLMFAYF